jgi:hypothetical protein
MYTMSIVARIAHVADIDTRLAMVKAGLDVPPRRVTIPNITLIPWDHHGFWIERRIGRFHMSWYPGYGFAHFKNQRTMFERRMDIHTTMKVSFGRENEPARIKTTYHPDYKEACKCGCGYNTDRSHKRILPRAVPRSFTK